MCGCVGLKPTTGRIYQGGRRVCAIVSLQEIFIFDNFTVI